MAITSATAVIHLFNCSNPEHICAPILELLNHSSVGNNYQDKSRILSIE
jgi:hypothetical protein